MTFAAVVLGPDRCVSGVQCRLVAAVVAKLYALGLGGRESHLGAEGNVQTACQAMRSSMTHAAKPASQVVRAAFGFQVQVMILDPLIEPQQA